MYLLNTSLLKLVEFTEADTPEYAILSHTWGEEEVSFQDIQYVSQVWCTLLSQTASAIKSKSGYTKIKRSAELARSEGHEFIWVDTCCIDNRSSAELSEAINSMYRWYSRAVVCYVYLDDVRFQPHGFNNGEFYTLCQPSRWFTRGWTLQELIAPKNVVFYTADWKRMGNKNHRPVRRALATITEINELVLEGVVSPLSMSVAARMKWASRRQTTRAEDIAYSLMGIFGVNMPLLYGEGTKAFVRLQEEILKGSNDHTIFAWKMPKAEGLDTPLSGLLADSPAAFADIEDYRPLPPITSRGSMTWTITNHGLRIPLFLRAVVQDNESKADDEFDAILECASRRGNDWFESPSIRVRRLYGDQFARVDPQTVRTIQTPSYEDGSQASSYKVIFIKQKPVYTVPNFMVSYENIHWRKTSRPTSVYLESVWPERYWDSRAATLQSIPPDNGCIVGLFRFSCSPLVVDYAIGLQRNQGGSWGCWSLQRRSHNDTVQEAVASANEFLIHEAYQMRGEASLYQHGSGTFEWKRNTNALSTVDINIEHTTIHGRPCFFVRARFKQGDLESRLQNLLMDATEPISLQDIFFAKTPDSARIRVAPLIMIPQQIQHLTDSGTLIRGVSEAEQRLRACLLGVLDELDHVMLGDPRLEDSAEDSHGMRPIHCAIIGGHKPVVKGLLELGADISSRTTHGWSPFHVAALFGRFQILELLIDELINRTKGTWAAQVIIDDRDNALSENILHLAVIHISQAGGEELLALLRFLNWKATSSAWNSVNHLGETPLHRLAAMGDGSIELVQSAWAYEFIPHPHDHLLDKHGRSLLWYAVCSGAVAMAKKLIELNRRIVNMMVQRFTHVN
ncbi:hypothetical protein S40285_09574 [Stachybotrys chlorohalonatus IBT 40285]|uniref:Heterokaryon incompatibility domain-containing protein n=1 Tax=Stachybotrys chlorohalonatus (strain IBT 40285) TaxID=1283841 RepID=A0A084QRY7_STAC4|nr:hypothetical protein S40285_09574 [Stachybotrys chlorohalonata IBT 40285]